MPNRSSQERFRDAVLDNRARLILREPKVTAEVTAFFTALLARWRREVLRAAGGSATEVAELARKAVVLARLGEITAATAAQVAARMNTTVRTVYRQETVRQTHIIQRYVTEVDASAGIAFQGINARAIEAALRLPIPGADLTVSFNNLAADAEAAMRRDVARAIADGWKVDRLAEKWAKGRGAGRIRSDAASLARTAVHHAANAANVALYNETPELIRGVQWEASFDTRTCFRKGVLVATARGPVPIEQVQSGDIVFTHRRRWRRVLDTTSRPFSGNFARVRTARGDLVSTDDHRVWVAGRGWTAAAGIEPGQELIRLAPVVSGEETPIPKRPIREAVHAVTLEPYAGEVHCLVVEEDESFFADGFAVHNCIVCASLHGRQWVLGSEPAIPQHFSCRCVLLPVFLDPALNSPAGPLPTHGRHLDVTTLRIQDREFETWLRAGSEGTQRVFFPSEYKFEAWRAGRVTLPQLVSPDGSILTDPELRAFLTPKP